MRNTLMAMAAGFALCGATAAVAQPAGTVDKDALVKPTLIADTTALKPDTTFTLGVLYKAQPGWHIYWKYPGGSGFATTVQWGLPPGASQSDTMYPVPLTFESPGPIISYGYEGETMLLMEARAADLPSDGQVKITAKTRWLMCSNRCIPNSKELTLTLPVGEGKPANTEIFDKYRKLLPKKVADLPNEVATKITHSGSSSTFNVTVTPPAGKNIVAAHAEGAHQAYFYPYAMEGYMIDPPKVEGKTKDLNGIKVYDGPVTISFKADPNVDSAEPAKHLEGVLVYQFASASGKEDPVILEVKKAD